MIQITVVIDVSKQEQILAEQWAKENHYEYKNDPASLYADYLISRHYEQIEMPSYQASLT